MAVDTPADLLVTVDGGLEEVLSLQRWLSEQDDFAGRARLLRSDPGPGQMGTVLDTITIAAGGGGALTALLGTMSVWMRHRGAKITATVKKGNRSVTIDADRVRSADIAALREMVAEFSRTLDEG
ncbi:effector-associated constant component EACC1 [Plantactinospora sp. WMMB782]|uniref:effector-associated constant component EACC1 n=1 Tax=Plantactinospora sp. WMMB782 TaxID=3404121 RepID=UPI003B9293D0